MDLLQQVIAQKRKQIIDVAIESGSGSKMIKHADLFSREKAAYMQKIKKEEGEQLRTSNSVVNLDNVLEETSNMTDLPRHEAIKKLRARGQPIRLFAETDKEALKRLRRYEMEQSDFNEGWQNEFQSALKKVENEELEEVIKGKREDDKALDVMLSETQGDATWDQIHSRAQHLFEGSDPIRDCEVIKDFLNYLLKRWGRNLNARPLHIKRSFEGKTAAVDHQQTLEMLRPLMQTLEKNNLNSDIRCHLVNICWLCVVDRDYIRASNSYMEMSIGNAPWPVGVTRSGIHQRPGSSKAYVSNIAHVMNDETQRKYIHGVKRLMTRCQEYFPTDPSKCVEFVKPQKT